MEIEWKAFCHFTEYSKIRNAIFQGGGLFLAATKLCSNLQSATGPTDDT